MSKKLEPRVYIDFVYDDDRERTICIVPGFDDIKWVWARVVCDGEEYVTDLEQLILESFNSWER